MELLSEVWLGAVNEKLAATAGTRDDWPDEPVVLEQQVHGGPSGDVTVHLILSRRRAAALPGPAVEATVRFRQSWETAIAIRSGDLSPQSAVLSGRLRLEGDVGALVPWAAVLADLDRRLDAPTTPTTRA